MFIFLFVDEKIELKVAPLKCLLILKMLPVNHFKDHKAAISTLKKLTGGRL
jgi:hypothetical protein